MVLNSNFLIIVGNRTQSLVHLAAQVAAGSRDHPRLRDPVPAVCSRRVSSSGWCPQCRSNSTVRPGPSGQKNIKYARTVSAPYLSTSSSGGTVLPRLLDIFSWSSPNTMPWLRNCSMGSFPFGDTHVPQRLVEKARVKQVHGGMLDPACIGIHRHPVVVFFRVEGTFIVIRAQVTQVVPGGAHEGIHGIGFPLGSARRISGRSCSARWDAALAGFLRWVSIRHHPAEAPAVVPPEPEPRRSWGNR